MSVSISKITTECLLIWTVGNRQGQNLSVTFTNSGGRIFGKLVVLNQKEHFMRMKLSCGF